MVQGIIYPAERVGQGGHTLIFYVEQESEIDSATEDRSILRKPFAYQTDWAEKTDSTHPPALSHEGLSCCQAISLRWWRYRFRDQWCCLY